jgi:hypothetical protein
MAHQQEFLFAGGPTPQLHPPDPRSGFYDEVSNGWQLPVGRVVRVDLKDHDLPSLQGLLELSRAPDLPLDPRQPLALRIRSVEFSSRQIAAWAIV